MELKEKYFLLLCLTFAISTALMMVGSIFEIVTCRMIGYVFLWISAMILVIRCYAISRRGKRNIL